MGQTKRATSGCRTDTLERTRAKKDRQRSKQCKANDTKVRRSGNDFLTFSFKTLAALDIDPLYSVESYQYLYDTAKNYSALIGKEFKLKPNPADFTALYEYFDKNIDGNQHLKVEINENRLSFKIVQVYNNNILYYIPCEIVDKTKGTFRKILIEFFRQLQWSQKLTYLTDSQNWGVIEDDLEFHEESGELDNDYADELRSYLNGDISKTLALVNSKPIGTHYELRNSIDKYRPKSKKEATLIELLRQGVLLFEQNKCILHYSETPNSEDLYDNGVITADELMQVVYADDWMVHNLIESMNVQCQECDTEFFSAGKIELTPETQHTIKLEKYVVDFLSWLPNLINKLYEY